jgi:small subunit ribosomal protein S1
LHLTLLFREEEEKNVKTATEKSSSSAANASTLGSTDVLAALKAKMERQRKIIS